MKSLFSVVVTVEQVTEEGLAENVLVTEVSTVVDQLGGNSAQCTTMKAPEVSVTVIVSAPEDPRVVVATSTLTASVVSRRFCVQVEERVSLMDGVVLPVCHVAEMTRIFPLTTFTGIPQDMGLEPREELFCWRTCTVGHCAKEGEAQRRIRIASFTGRIQESLK